MNCVWNGGEQIQGWMRGIVLEPGVGIAKDIVINSGEKGYIDGGSLVFRDETDGRCEKK